MLSLSSKAISIFEDDERFKAVERAKDREDLFENYKEELEKKVHSNCHCDLLKKKIKQLNTNKNETRLWFARDTYSGRS